ncbi:MAG: hypothetical protein JWP43_1059 [Ramlibacter sp.]|jgi:hypothetical protein|nr:hypothetical protein [Ramlibacter sp.]
MTKTYPGSERPADKADHGVRNEVTWDGGAGSQPYGNQGAQEAEEPNAPDDEVPEGNRGESSGRNQEQLAEVKKKP